MADESDLRDRFRDDGSTPPTGIDLDAVLRRARARRGRRAALAGAGGLLAAAAVVAPIAALSVPPAPPAAITAADDGGEDAADAAAGSAEAAPAGADGLWRCGAPAPDLSAETPGLELRVEPVTVDEGATGVELRVTLTNTGDEPVSASSPLSPQVALLDDEGVLWHTPTGASELQGVVIDLEPGAEAEYPARLDAVVCGPDDEADGLAGDLPAAPPGDYRVVVALDVTLDDGTVVLLVSEQEAVSVR